MQAQVISFHCTLTDKVGKVISSTFNQDVITQCQGGFLKGLSEGLQNLKAGEKRRITLCAREAYGYYDPALVIHISRSRVPNGMCLSIGDHVVLGHKSKKTQTFRVVETSKFILGLDGNHPLAGHDLTFEVEGVQNRDATREELAESLPDHFDHFYYN